MVDSVVVVGTKNYLIYIFLSKLRRMHKGNFVGGRFKQFEEGCRNHSQKEEIVKATISKITDNQK